MKHGVCVKGAPGAIGPYSQANVASDGTVYVSGQVPVNPETNELVTDIREAARQVLRNIQNILADQDMTLDDVLKTTVFLTDLANFKAVNEEYATFFKEPYPARSCIQVAALPLGATIEIECIAKK